MSIKLKKTNEKRLKRKGRIRNRVSGTDYRPRLSVFRTSKHIYCQIINDSNGVTLVSASSVEKLVKEKSKFDSKTALANFIGKLLAKRAVDKGITKVVFDRNGFFYHGRVKALSNGARENGLNF